MDIRLYRTTGNFPLSPEPIEELEGTLLSTPKVSSRSEVLANKVLKYFLTDKGTDLLDKDYGSTCFQTTQISKKYLPLFKLEVKNDVDRCLQYFQKRDKGKERITQIILKDIKYIDNSEKTATRAFLDTPWVSVALEVITNKNNRASVEVWRT